MCPALALRRAVVAPLISCLALSTACARGAGEPPQASPVETSQASVMTPQGAPATTGGAAEAGAVEGAAEERKRVRSAELQLEVQSHAAARASIDAALARVGGHIAEARVQHEDGAVAFAHFELRVPAASLDTLLAEIAQLGTVLTEQLRSNEITGEYHDGAARLRNARRLEERLLQFAGERTSDVKGLLEVERELARVRDEIETLQARVTGYDRQVALSAVTLGLTSRERMILGEQLGFGERMSRAFRESAHALGAAARGLLLGAAFVAPWLPPFAIAGVVVWRLTRRRPRSSG